MGEERPVDEETEKKVLKIIHPKAEMNTLYCETDDAGNLHCQVGFKGKSAKVSLVIPKELL